MGAVYLAFGCLCKTIETQTEGNFQKRQVATSISDVAKAIPSKTENRALIVAVLSNIAAELTDDPGLKQVLPFPKRS